MSEPHADSANKPQASALRPGERPVNWQDVGAEFTLPTLGLIAAAAAAASGVGLLAWPILLRFKPAGIPAIAPAVGAVVGAFLIGTLAMRPWKTRRLGRLPMLWLAGRGICFLAALALGALIYSAPPKRPDALAFGLVLAGAYFAALLAESAVMARRLRAPSGPKGDRAP